MRVAMYYKNDDVRLEEMPKPETGPGELLVKVRACGICGSDVMEWYRVKSAPRVLGHELSGDIVEVGKGVTDFKVGDRVMVTHHVPCQECHYCAMGHQSVCDTLRTTNFDPGGFSEYLRVPAINVEKGTFKLPDDMSYDEATFIEPLACVVRGQRHADVRKGQTVLVIGSGMSGLLHIMLARTRGVSRIIATDISGYKLDIAAEVGAESTIIADEDVPARVKELNGGRLADIVIHCTGARPALRQAIQSVDRGGTLLLFAPPPPAEEIPVPLGRYWTDEVTITTSYAGPPEDIIAARELIHKGEVIVADLITHRLPLEETQEGFRLAASDGGSIKVIIHPNKE